MYKITGCTARLGLGDVPYGDKQVMCLCLDKKSMILNNCIGFEQGIRRIIDIETGRDRYFGELYAEY